MTVYSRVPAICSHRSVGMSAPSNAGTTTTRNAAPINVPWLAAYQVRDFGCFVPNGCVNISATLGKLKVAASVSKFLAHALRKSGRSTKSQSQVSHDFGLWSWLDHGVHVAVAFDLLGRHMCVVPCGRRLFKGCGPQWVANRVGGSWVFVIPSSFLLECSVISFLFGRQGGQNYSSSFTGRRLIVLWWMRELRGTNRKGATDKTHAEEEGTGHQMLAYPQSQVLAYPCLHCLSLFSRLCRDQLQRSWDQEVLVPYGRAPCHFRHVPSILWSR